MPGLNAVLTTAVQVYVPITLGCCALTAVCAWGMPYWFDLDPAVVDEVRWTTMLVGGSIAFTFVFNIFTGIQYGLQRFEPIPPLSGPGGLMRTTKRFGAALVFVSLASVSGAGMQTPVDAAAARAAFEQFKLLAGEWDARSTAGWAGIKKVTVLARSSAVLT